jgi:prepilin-type N-terminal cleavage/methylation domain-containing protein
MLNRLFSTIKRGSRKIGQGGYTLIEVAAVVAITATLAAVVVPIAVDKVQDGKLVSAKLDIQAIAAGITAFNKDTGVWPVYSAVSGAVVPTVLRSGTKKGEADTIEITATHVTGANGFDPSASAVLWTGGTFAHLDGQLVTKPAGLTSSYNWKGPYVESFKKKDPWGNNYLVYVRAMGTPSVGSTKEYGWIISAGPDGVLQTGPLDSVIKDNDIGLMLFSATDTRAEGTAQ